MSLVACARAADASTQESSVVVEDLFASEARTWAKILEASVKLNGEARYEEEQIEIKEKMIEVLQMNSRLLEQAQQLETSQIADRERLTKNDSERKNLLEQLELLQRKLEVVEGEKATLVKERHGLTKQLVETQNNLRRLYKDNEQYKAAQLAICKVARQKPEGLLTPVTLKNGAAAISSNPPGQSSDIIFRGRTFASSNPVSADGSEVSQKTSGDLNRRVPNNRLPAFLMGQLPPPPVILPPERAENSEGTTRKEKQRSRAASRTSGTDKNCEVSKSRKKTRKKSQSSSSAPVSASQPTCSAEVPLGRKSQGQKEEFVEPPALPGDEQHSNPRVRSLLRARSSVVGPPDKNRRKKTDESLMADGGEKDLITESSSGVIPAATSSGLEHTANSGADLSEECHKAGAVPKNVPQKIPYGILHKGRNEFRKYTMGDGEDTEQEDEDEASPPLGPTNKVAPTHVGAEIPDTAQPQALDTKPTRARARRSNTRTSRDSIPDEKSRATGKMMGPQQRRRSGAQASRAGSAVENKPPSSAAQWLSDHPIGEPPARIPNELEVVLEENPSRPKIVVNEVGIQVSRAPTGRRLRHRVP